eukprot:2775391-Lingulodinium_polyedra.AAC.1
MVAATPPPGDGQATASRRRVGPLPALGAIQLPNHGDLEPPRGDQSPVDVCRRRKRPGPAA